MSIDCSFLSLLKKVETHPASHQCRFWLGKSLIELESASKSLHDLATMAFGQMRFLTNDDEHWSKKSDLTINFWDDQTAGWTTPAYAGQNDSGGRLFFRDGKSRFTWDSASKSWSIYDSAAKRGYWQVPSVHSVEGHELAAPFRKIFHWWSSDQGMQLVHAAAVGCQNGGVLLVGRGGSGKSTTSLSVLSKKLMFCGDDYCMVSIGATPTVFSLYDTGKINACSAKKIPWLQEAFTKSKLRIQEKAVIYPTKLFPGSMIRQMPLRAIVVPSIAHLARPRLTPISNGEAFRALAPSTLLQMPGEREASMSRLAKLCQSLPCFRLELTENPCDSHSSLESLLPH